MDAVVFKTVKIFTRENIYTGTCRRGLNVNLDQSSESSNKNTLNEIFDIYGLDQLIQEPTRVTESFN